MNTERKLATIEEVIAIAPIQGADKIDVATVRGWQVVVKKGQFQPGDQCCYVEIDSRLPERPEYEFMRSRKFKVKTCKLKGQVSQGIVFKVSDVLPPGSYFIGQDVTAELGVEKIEDEDAQDNTPRPPIGFVEKLLRRLGLVKRGRVGNFPSFIPKTNQERIQNCKGILETFKGQEFVATIKMDGQSATFYQNGRTFGVLSREVRRYTYTEPPFWLALFGIKPKSIKPSDNYCKMVIQHDIQNKLKKFGRNIAIQGEIVGPSIQKNRQKYPKMQFWAFDIFDIDKQEYYEYNDFVGACKEMGLNMVPSIGTNVMNHTLEDFIQLSVQYDPNQETQLCEGIVVRKTKNELGKKISFKVINPEYLISNNL